MAELKYHPVPHDHDAFLEKARKRKGFDEAYADLEDEYLLVRELLAAPEGRSHAGAGRALHGHDEERGVAPGVGR